MTVKTIGIISGSLPDELLKLLLSLASKWGDVIDENAFNLKVIPLTSAMTNKIYRISWSGMKQDDHLRTVLVRFYGEGVEHFFNRDDEIRTFECMSENGRGPKLLGKFAEGRVEEFLHARTLSAVDLRDPEISALIAAKLREFHKLDMPGPKRVVLWDRLRNWLSVAKSLASPEPAKEFCLDSLDKEICILEKELSRDDLDIGFCHNDLHYSNIMISEQTRSIHIIDYEYATYNPVAYDLANHFCEMVANYHTDTPHVLNYKSYPGPEERQRFIRNYLSSSGHQPTDAEVERLVEDTEKYTLANHLFWGLWGIIATYVKNLDFECMEFSRQRFQQYWLKKPLHIKHSRFN